MELLVQKFAGTSVANLECIHAVAKRIAVRHKETLSIAILRTAIGNTTETSVNVQVMVLSEIRTS